MKKIISLFILFIFIISPLTVLAESKTVIETPVADGVSVLDLTYYTSAGTHNAKVLKADLGNPRVNIRLLSDTRGVSYLSSVKNLAASDERVIGAVNGDFFAWYYKDKTRGSAVGLNVENGELVSSAPVTEELASLVFTDEGAVLTQYFRPDMKVTTQSGRTEVIGTLNKYDSLETIAMYNSSWGKTFTCGGGNERVAVVVKNKVTEIISEEKEVEIPEDGYLLAGLADHTDFFEEGIKPGDKLKTDIYFTPYFDDIKTAVGGGTVLIKNGEKAPVTHLRNGRDFRTAAGISRDGKTLYLITVDKNSKSVGMTLDELRNLMFDLDIYDGLNLDGGGSTQMVARSYGDSSHSYINSPENGYYRPVTNALAITVSGGKRGTPQGIAVKTDTSSMNIYETVSASFALYDQLYYPLEIDEEEKVTYTFSGVSGTVSGNEFTPDEKGNLTIGVKYKKYYAEKTIPVFDPDKYVDCDSLIYYADPGESFIPEISAITLGGEKRNIPLTDVKVTVDSSLAAVENGKIKAKKVGFGEIKFSYGDFSFSAYLSVGGYVPEDALSETTSFTDTFDTLNGTALSYPADTSSNYVISNEQSGYSGKSGKLWFDFTGDITEIQSAALVFDKPVTFSHKGAKLSLDFFSPGLENVSLKAMVYDAGGNPVRLTLNTQLDEEGFRIVSLTMPDNISLPAKLSRLYIVENEPETKEKGAVFFDNLTLTDGSDGDYEKDNLVKDSFSPAITITGGMNSTNTLLSPIVRSHIAKNISLAPLSYSFDGTTSAENTISKQSSMAFTRGNITFVQYKDILQFKEALSSSKDILVIANDTLNDYARETIPQLIEKEEGKTVFVVTKGETINVTIEKNIRFITLPAITPSILLNQKTFVTLDIGIKNGKAAYKINRIKLWDK